MSQPKRYTTDVGYGHEDKDGEFVLWDDYAALADENERLRKAGKESAQAAYSWRELYQMLKARWEAAAKEGRDAK